MLVRQQQNVQSGQIIQADIVLGIEGVIPWVCQPERLLEQRDVFQIIAVGRCGQQGSIKAVVPQSLEQSIGGRFSDFQ